MVVWSFGFAANRSIVCSTSVTSCFGPVRNIQPSPAPPCLAANFLSRSGVSVTGSRLMDIICTSRPTRSPSSWRVREKMAVCTGQEPSQLV